MTATARQRLLPSARTRRLCVALALAGLAAGCDNPPPKGQFPLSLKEAYDRLDTHLLPDFVSNRQCGIVVRVSTEVEENRSVTWHIKSSGEKMLSFTATLTPVDARNTKVAITVSPGKDGREAYDGTQFYRRPALRQPVRPAIEEQVAALLDRRPFDPARMRPATIVKDDGAVAPAPKDSVCLVQRAGLESGIRFSVDDPINR